MRLRFICLAVTVIAMPGCDVSSHTPVTIAVYPGAERCTAKINEAEQAVKCAELGKHLRDVAKLRTERQIDVSMFQMDKSHDPKDVDKVAETLRSAGFTDVKVWRFGME